MLLALLWILIVATIGCFCIPMLFLSRPLLRKLARIGTLRATTLRRLNCGRALYSSLMTMAGPLIFSNLESAR